MASKESSQLYQQAAPVRAPQLDLPGFAQGVRSGADNPARGQEARAGATNLSARESVSRES